MKKTLFTAFVVMTALAAPTVSGDEVKTKDVDFSDVVSSKTQWTASLNPAVLSKTDNTNADYVKKVFTESNSFSGSGMYWGVSNGQDVMRTDGQIGTFVPKTETEEQSNGFAFYGRQGYGGEYCGIVVKVGDLANQITDANSTLTSIQLSGTRKTWQNVVFSVWSISADKSTVNNLQSVGTMSTNTTAGGVAYSSNALDVTGLTNDDYVLFLFGQSSGGLENYFWDNTFTLTYSVPETLTSTAVVTAATYAPDAVSGDMVLTLTTGIEKGSTLGNVLEITFNNAALWESVVDSGNIYQEASVLLTYTDGDLIELSAFDSVSVNGVVLDSKGKAFVAYIPEPATCALSLLALAGMAVRRRRK